MRLLTDLEQEIELTCGMFYSLMFHVLAVFLVFLCLNNYILG